MAEITCIQDSHSFPYAGKRFEILRVYPTVEDWGPLLAGGIASQLHFHSSHTCVKGISRCRGPRHARTDILLFLWADQTKVTC